MKLRFSLRAMLVVFTLAVAFCVWRDRPRRMANRFVDAIAARQYETAEDLFADGEQPFVVQFMEGDDRNRIEAERQSPTPSQWLTGKCPVAVKLEDFRGLGASIVLNVTATAGGILRGSEPESITAIRYAPDPILREDIRR